MQPETLQNLRTGRVARVWEVKPTKRARAYRRQPKTRDDSMFMLAAATTLLAAISLIV